MSEGASHDDAQIKTIEKVALSIERCRGNYAFLVGAGTSSAAGIKTGGELIDQWQQEEYNRIEPDQEKSDWVKKKESKIKTHQNRYGFWFEEAYTTREERRRFIKGLVEDVDPTFEHVVLSSLMLREYVPITLTPNFDDLIYNAFYSYLEERPLLVDHNALAPQFKIVSGDPMLVKLHGDYLYDNLKNTSAETNELEENIKEVLEKILGEFGLIVLGYSGRDESIMSVLNSEDIDIPDEGLYWCTTDKENLSPKVEQLLKKRNTYLVEIDSSMEFFYELYESLEDLSVPTPVDLRERANERADQLEESIVRVGGVEALGLAREYKRRKEFQNAIDLLTRSIENGVKDRDVYKLRADLYGEVGNHEAAIADLNHILDEIDQEKKSSEDEEYRQKLNERELFIHNKKGIIYASHGFYSDACERFEFCVNMLDGTMMHELNLAEAKIMADNIDDGKNIANTVLKNTGQNKKKANCLILIAFGNILQDRPIDEEKEKLQKLSEEGFVGNWNFDELDYYLSNEGIGEEKEEKMREINSIYEEGSAEIGLVAEDVVLEYEKDRAMTK